MWLSDKRFQAALACTLMLALSACGFRPLYGDAATEAGDRSALQGNVTITTSGKTRFDQVLRIALEDNFNPQGLVNAHPDYDLRVGLTRTLIPSVVRSDGTILRYDVRFETAYTLINNNLKPADKGYSFSGKTRRTSSYNVVPNANFATYEAEQNLNERMLREIAEDYVLRISGHLAAK